MTTTAPFGYKEIAPFRKADKVRLLASGEVPAFAAGAHALPISYSEFPPVCRDYPVVFITEDGGKSFGLVALTGVKRGENLFCQDGRWANDVYVPAYVRRYPFCMARVAGDESAGRRVVCVEKSSLDAKKGEAMFDAGGVPVTKWLEMERMLNEYELDLERSRELCAIVSECELLEPFTMQATPSSGEPIAVTGMHRVDEARIGKLKPSQIKRLIDTGILSRIYLHLASQQNFGRLVMRQAGRAAAPAAA